MALSNRRLLPLQKGTHNLKVNKTSTKEQERHGGSKKQRENRQWCQKNGSYCYQLYSYFILFSFRDFQKSEKGLKPQQEKRVTNEKQFHREPFICLQMMKHISGFLMFCQCGSLLADILFPNQVTCPTTVFGLLLISSRPFFEFPVLYAKNCINVIPLLATLQGIPIVSVVDFNILDAFNTWKVLHFFSCSMKPSKACLAYY